MILLIISWKFLIGTLVYNAHVLLFLLLSMFVFVPIKQSDHPKL